MFSQFKKVVLLLLVSINLYTNQGISLTEKGLLSPTGKIITDKIKSGEVKCHLKPRQVFIPVKLMELGVYSKNN